MTETPDDGDKNTKKDTDHKGIFDSFKELVRAAGDQRNPYLRFALLLILVVVFTIIALAVIGRQIDAAAERLIDIALIGAILVAILLIFRHQSRADAAPEAASSQPTPPMSVTCEPTATFRQIVLITPAVSNFFDLIVSSVSITAHKEQLNVIVKVPNRRFEAAAQNSLINAVCDDLVRGEVVVVVPAEPAAVREDLNRLCIAHRTIPPLVALDIPLEPVSGGDVTDLRFPFVGVDNVRGAELAADAFAEHFRTVNIAQPSLYVLFGPPNIPQWRQRAEAFIARFTANMQGNCTITRSDAVAHWDRRIARDLTSRYLASGAAIDGIFACNDDLALGARQAVLQWRQVGNSTPVRIVGFDGIDEMYELLAQRDEIMLATVNVRVAEQVKSVMELVTARVDGKAPPFERRLIEPYLVKWATTERPQLEHDGEDAA